MAPDLLFAQPPAAPIAPKATSGVPEPPLVNCSWGMVVRDVSAHLGDNSAAQQ